MAKQTKVQKQEYAKAFFLENASVRTLYQNPKGEWFTDESYANNSLPKKDGKRVGKLEIFESDFSELESIEPKVPEPKVPAPEVIEPDVPAPDVTAPEVTE